MTKVLLSALAIVLGVSTAGADQGTVTAVHDGYYNTCVQINGKWYTPKVSRQGGDPHLQLTEQRAWMTLATSYYASRSISFDVLNTFQDCRFGAAAEITDINDPPVAGQ